MVDTIRHCCVKALRKRYKQGRVYEDEIVTCKCHSQWRALYTKGMFKNRSDSFDFPDVLEWKLEMEKTA